MEVRFSADKEASLREVALRTGRSAEQVVEEAVNRLLDFEAHFTAAVEQGLTSARRGDLLEHDDVVERIENILRS
jgi:predicted transcriptional regulator